MTICPECEKEFTAPKISFQTGNKPGREKFEYAVCSCPDCDKCFGISTPPVVDVSQFSQLMTIDC